MVDTKIVITAEDRASAVLRNLRGSVDTSVAAFSKLTGVLGTLGLGAAVAGFKSIIGALDDLSEAAQGVGVSAVALAELRQAAAFAGVDAEKLDKALSGLSSRLSDAAKGGEESVAIFRALGVAVRNNDGTLRSADRVLADIADRFATYRDGAEKTALANALFGEKLGRVLIPYLNQGSGALREFAGLTKETVAEAEKLQKEFDRSAANATRLKNSLAGTLLPALNEIIEALPKIRFGEAFRAYGNEGVRGVIGNIETQARELRNSRARAEALIAEEGGRLSRLLDARKGVAPTPDKTGGKTQAEQISDAQRALAQYVETLQRELDTLEQITEQEKVLELLQKNPSIDTPQVRELLFIEADRVEKAREKKKLDEEATRLLQQQTAEAKALRDQVLELAGVAEEERKRVLTEQLEILIQQGLLTAEQAERAVKGIAGIRDEIEKTRDVADEFALVFTSSLGKLIEGNGGGIKSFFEALAQDVLKLTTRLLVLEPIAKSIKEIFGGSGGGGIGDIFSSFLGSLGFGGARALGGPVSAGRAYLVGERGPELFVPGASGGIVPNGGMGATININMPAGSNVDRSTASQVAAAVARQLSIAQRRYA